MYLHSISAHVDDILDRLDETSADALRNMKEGELIGLHHSWGRSIRNEFGFWDVSHPLTKNWHTNPDARILEAMGETLMIDNSPDHPDAVSMAIMKGVWKKINA